jgi:hypothetical protein
VVKEGEDELSMKKFATSPKKSPGAKIEPSSPSKSIQSSIVSYMTSPKRLS